MHEQRYYVSPSQINMGERMSCPPRRFVEEFCRLREKRWRKWNENAKPRGINDDDDNDVEVVEVDTTRKQLKIHFEGFSHEYDEWPDYDNERKYFPFVRLEKNVSPR